jgi:hypothetical protein
MTYLSNFFRGSPMTAFHAIMTIESDLNTCILRIKLTDGLLFNHGTRYDIDFT